LLHNTKQGDTSGIRTPHVAHLSTTIGDGIDQLSDRE
jgi:hypothetical protein